VTVASDFFTVVTVRFPVLYVFIVAELDCFQIVHFGATAHPTADWTLQFSRSSTASHRTVLHS
jgi:hypothetical protein